MLQVHFNEEDVPQPNQPWLPSVHGVVLGEKDSVLLHRREDSSLLAFPGGKLELGESLSHCLVREMHEETGLQVKPKKLLGVFSSPKYVLSIGEMYFQPLLFTFLCEVESGKLELGSESVAFHWATQKDIDELETFPLVKEIAKFVWKDTGDAFFDIQSL
ncbi:MAG: NUDIX domain-containing protein [Candidatus Paceibacterota bacterium]